MKTKDFIVFPGEKFDNNKELLTQGNFYLDTISMNLVSKNLFKLATDKDGNSQNFFLEGGFYNPSIGDVVLGTVTNKTADFYKIDINTYANALLNTIDFEGASKKNKPNLNNGDLVFAKVYKTNKFDAPLVTCISGNGKSWSSGEAEFGPVKSGHLFKVPLKYVQLYVFLSETLISRIYDAVDFEHYIGMNGFIWINSSSVKNILKIKEIFLLWASIVYDKLILNDLAKVEVESMKRLPDEIEKIINDTFIAEVNKNK